MAFYILSTVLALTSLARADYFSKEPLVNKVVPYNAILEFFIFMASPINFQVMTDRDDPRGFQSGYNICNSTTENQESLCQTMFVNHIDDFCLWAPAPVNTPISDSEGDVVAWCSQPGHGTRIIPPGAITGLQFIQTPSYIQIAGTLKQEMLNIGGLYGGELDSGGQDEEGNPMGGLVYTNSFPSNNGNNDSYQQAQRWSFFIGGNAFCGKVCDPTGKNPAGLCQNIYDRLDCEYNVPNNAAEGMFERCDGDDMKPVGTYVGTDGQTSVYKQPAETADLGVIPYTATPAPSSNCMTYASTDIFKVSATAAPQGTGATTAAPTGTGTNAGTTAKTTSPTGTSKTNTTAGATNTNGATETVGMSAGAIAFALFAMSL